MRPWIKVALALLVIGAFFAMFFVMQELKRIDDVAQGRHNIAVAAMLQTACLAYLTEYNRLPPSYDNKELTAALLGDNSRHLVFISLAPNQVNSDKEIIDRWGTALRINFLGNNGVQVISAGPDRLFNTPDDIVVNSPDMQTAPH
jgi:hypothetical protein